VPEVRADLTRGDAVLDPELANGRVTMGQREPIGRVGVALVVAANSRPT